MLRAAPGSEFEANVQFASGLLGTVGVRIRDAAGGDFLARTTAGILADVTVGARTLYRRAFLAPNVAGQFTLVWDDGTTIETEELLVTFSSLGDVLPSGLDLCTLADVVALAPGYTIGDEPETEATLASFITEQSEDFAEVTGREIVPVIEQPETRQFRIDQYTCEERQLDIGAAAAVTGIEIVDDDGTVWQTLDEAAWIAQPRTRAYWEPVETVEFPRRLAMAAAAQLVPGYLVNVTGTFGFPAIPKTVAGAVARLVLYRYLADATSKGTVFADAANLNEAANPGASRAAALDVRARFRRRIVG